MRPSPKTLGVFDFFNVALPFSQLFEGEEAQ